ncbi:MAG: hypothetical protein JWO00_469 [Candidatus Parcubacteria bacterium]|nr:hypothetical protein [Candidatus Parcubacteria bacterium]
MNAEDKNSHDQPATKSERELYEELDVWSLQDKDPEFPHQHIADAYAAQHPEECLRPIRLAFALAGLYLHAEKGVSGRNIQRLHMTMGRRKQAWPDFEWPDEDKLRNITVADALAAKPGPERSARISEWVKETWQAWAEVGDNRQLVIDLLASYGIV